MKKTIDVLMCMTSNLVSMKMFGFSVTLVTNGSVPNVLKY